MNTWFNVSWRLIHSFFVFTRPVADLSGKILVVHPSVHFPLGWRPFWKSWICSCTHNFILTVHLVTFTDMCNTIWSIEYIYEPTNKNCMVMQFQGENPNSKGDPYTANTHTNSASFSHSLFHIIIVSVSCIMWM